VAGCATRVQDVDDVELRRAGESGRVLVDDRAPRRHGIDHAALAAAALRRHVEDIDDGIFDREVDGLAQAPAHGRAQFGRRHVGRLDQDELVLACGQHIADGCGGRPADAQGPRRFPTDLHLPGAAAGTSQRSSTGRDAASRCTIGGAEFTARERNANSPMDTAAFQELNNGHRMHTGRKSSRLPCVG
jgi:hypothetical protein